MNAYSLDTEAPVSTSTFQKLPSARQAAILDAAARVFAETGYAQSSVASICAAAGISNGALYKYFQNKHDLFVAIVRRMNHLMLQHPKRLRDLDGSIWVVLRQVLYEAVLFVQEHRDYFVIYMDLGSPSMDSFASALSDEVEGWSMDFFCRIVDRAKEAGEIRHDLDTRSAAYLLDNHMMLFGFSMVSEHYNRRLHKYFGHGQRAMNDQDKVDRVMASCKQLLTSG